MQRFIALGLACALLAGCEVIGGGDRSDEGEPPRLILFFGYQGEEKARLRYVF